MCSSCHWKGYNGGFGEGDDSPCLLPWLLFTGQSGESSLALISQGTAGTSHHEPGCNNRQFQKVEAKTKVSALRNFPRTVDLDGLCLCFHFGRWCCLHAEFHSPNGASIVESVLLRSGKLLQYVIILPCVALSLLPFLFFPNGCTHAFP